MCLAENRLGSASVPQPPGTSGPQSPCPLLPSGERKHDDDHYRHHNNQHNHDDHQHHLCIVHRGGLLQLNTQLAASQTQLSIALLNLG